MEKVRINTQDRKELAHKIGELVGVAAVYAGAGGNAIEGERFRYSYVVMNITIAQDCTIVWDERTDAETMSKVFDGLAEAGYEFERLALETANDADMCANGEEEIEADTEAHNEAEWHDKCDQEQPHEDWENCAEDFREMDELPPKRKGIIDILVDEFNANAPEGTHWERLNSTPMMECGDGKWRNLNGTFASTTGNATETETKAETDTDTEPAEKPDKRELPRLYTLNTPRGEIFITEEFETHDDAANEGYGEYFTTALGTVYSYGDNHTFALVTSCKAGDWDNTTIGRDFRSEATEDTPETITIELPFNTNGRDIEPRRETLQRLIGSKASLIKTALGENGTGDLPIEFTEDGTVRFEWLKFGTDAEDIQAWSAFLAAAVKFSMKAQRITATDKAVENEKFTFRTFLVKIGMNDTENKLNRKRLLQNLTGDSAFATPESKAKWQVKHGKKGGAE